MSRDHGLNAFDLVVLHLDHSSLTTSVDVAAHLLEREYFLAEVTLGQWIRALNRLMPNQFLFENAFTTPFTNNASVIALSKLVSAEKKFIIRKLVLALAVVAFEANLIQVLVLQLVQGFKSCIRRALARCCEELGRIGALPSLEAGSTEVCFAATAFSALYNHKVAELTLE